MNTYFAFLDFASLFSLLVRLHYEDLVNLCRSRNYLWRITCTPIFQEVWKSYNITVRIYKYDKPTLLGVSEIHSEVDRCNKLHGKQLRYNNNNELSESDDFVQDVCHGVHVKWNCFKVPEQPGQPENYRSREEFPYVNGEIHGTAASYYGNGVVSYTQYKHSRIDGLIRGFNGSFDSIMWSEYKNNMPFGKDLEWKADGSLLHIKSTRNYEKHGKQIEWHRHTNAKYREYTCIDGILHGSFKRWDDQGVLIQHHEYEHGIKIK